MRVNGLAGIGVVLATVAGAVGAARAATRLDRLHVRTNAAWRALDEALLRRAEVVQRLAGHRDAARSGVPSGGTVLRVETDSALRAAAEVAARAAADAALAAGPALREEFENELSRVLAVLDRSTLAPAEAASLTDAEERVVLARRVYNDAVRDTLALRSHHLVRWLKLAATAPQPRYFEIAEPPSATG